MSCRPVYLLCRIALRLRANIRGGIGVIAALSLPAVIGAAGLAADLNRGLAQREIDQRAADMAALGAATAYKASASAAILQPTAQDIVAVNGLSGAAVSATLVANYPATGSQAVKVTVSQTLPYTLSRVLGFSRSYTVTAESYASLASAPAYAAPCFLALYNGSQALTTSGGATIGGTGCAVAAVGSIANGGTSITASDIISGSGAISNDYGTLSAKSLRYAGAFTNPSWNTNVPPANARVNQATTLVDPWASSRELSQARAQIGVYVAVPTLSNPTTAGKTATNWSFDYSPVAPVKAYQTSQGNYTVPAGTYAIGKLSVAGGVSVTFQSGSTITVDSGLANAGKALTFGDVNLSVNGGFDTGSSGITIGKGTLSIGSGTATFNGTNIKGDGAVAINAVLTMGGGQKLTMGAGQHYFGGFVLSGGGSVTMGPGAFVAQKGVQIAGGSELSIGAGDVAIGPDGNSNAISVSGGANLFMGDGAFGANGNIVTSGGSRIIFGRTLNHQINGALTIDGGALFGAGRYTIKNGLTNTVGSNGGLWPFTSSFSGKTYGQSIGGQSTGGFDMVGADVTFILGGVLNLGGGAKTKLIAPFASVSGGQIADMLLHTMSGSTTAWAAGAGNNFSGTVYLPNSTVTLSGGNSTLSAGQCFVLIAYKITATGGAALGTACATMISAYGSGGAATVRLIK